MVATCEKISEAFLLPVIRALLDGLPFRILGFHADNGSEYINHSFAEKFPFAYTEQLARDLTPFLAIEEQSPQLSQWIADFRARELRPGINSIDFLMAVNCKTISSTWCAWNPACRPARKHWS